MKKITAIFTKLIVILSFTYASETYSQQYRVEVKLNPFRCGSNYNNISTLMNGDITIGGVKKTFNKYTGSGNIIFDEVFNYKPYSMNLGNTYYNLYSNFSCGSMISNKTVSLTPNHSSIGQYKLYYFNSSTGNGVLELLVTFTLIPCPTLSSGVIGSNQFFCYSGNPSNLISIYNVVGGNGIYYYQWQFSINEGNTWTDINNATSVSYDPLNVNRTTWYRRKVISCSQTKYSNIVKITVLTLHDIGNVPYRSSQVKVNEVPSKLLSRIISIYPNPAINHISIQYKQALSEIPKIQILDIKGRVIINVKDTKNSIDISSLKRGTYFLQVKTALGKTIKRFMKE